MNNYEVVKKEDGTEFVILGRYPSVDYVLLERNSKYQPYVAAWGYDDEHQCWAQGHYFERLIDAAEWILAKEGQLIAELKDKYEVYTFVDGYDTKFKIRDKASGITNIYDDLEELSQAVIVLTKEFGYYRALEIAEKAIDELQEWSSICGFNDFLRSVDFTDEEKSYFEIDEEEE